MADWRIMEVEVDVFNDGAVEAAGRQDESKEDFTTNGKTKSHRHVFFARAPIGWSDRTDDSRNFT